MAEAPAVPAGDADPDHPRHPAVSEGQAPAKQKARGSSEDCDPGRTVKRSGSPSAGCDDPPADTESPQTVHLSVRLPGSLPATARPGSKARTGPEAVRRHRLPPRASECGARRRRRGYRRASVMTTSLEHPTKKALRGRPPLSPRGRTVACAIAAVAALLLVAGLAAAVGGRGPFAGEDAIDNAADRLPSGWAGLEPLLPLAPGLREMSDLKRSAAGGASRVLAARGGSAGALRVSALPPVGALVAAPGFAPATTPSVRVPPAGLVGPVGGARRLLRRTPSLGDLATIIDRELGGLPGGAVDGVAQIPPIDPLPNGVPRVVIPPVGPIPEVVIPPVGVPLPGGSGEPLPGVPLRGPDPWIPSRAAARGPEPGR